MAEVLNLVINDDFGLLDRNDGVDAGEGIYAYLGKPETNTLELNFLANIVDHEVDPLLASGILDIECSGCEREYGNLVGEYKTLKLSL